MLDLPCDAKRWLKIGVHPPADLGFSVLVIQHLDARGRLLDAASHLPLRPGRLSQRVLLAPTACVALRISWLVEDADLPLLQERDVKLTYLPPWQAAWLMQHRIRHFKAAMILPLLDLLLPSRLYSRYEATFAYYSVTSFQPLAVAKQPADASTSIVCLTPDSLNLDQPWSEKQWVVLQNPADTWVAGGKQALQHWLELNPAKRLVVFDEQRVSAAGGSTVPWLKPEWNPDLFLSSSYTGCGVAFRGDLFSELLQGLHHDGYTTAESYVDALLLNLMACHPDRYAGWIGRCSEVLLQTTESAEVGLLGAAIQLNREQTLQQLFSTGIRVVSGYLPNTWRVLWPLPEQPPLVSLCIPTRNGLEVLQPCIDAVLDQTSYKHFELLVVDNQSDCTATLDYLSQLPARDERVRVLRYDQPFNFAAINNFAATQARGEIFGLVNNDIEPRHTDWLTEMVRQVLRPDIGCVGAKLYYPSGRIQHAGVVLGIGGVAGHAFRFEPGDAAGYQGRLQLVQNYSAVTAACLLVRKSIYVAAGGMDERFAVAYNDVDFCLKVQSLGYHNLWTPYAVLTHHESITRGRNANQLQRRRAAREFDLMREKWGALLDADPAYHPKLTRAHEDFSLGCLDAFN